MRRDCTNNKRVMRTKGGYVTDEENPDDSSSEKFADDYFYVSRGCYSWLQDYY